MGSVLVVGSVNVDHVVTVPELPRPGATVLGSEYAMHLGGKGANQAVAAARLGAAVVLLGAVGDDPAGEASLRSLEDEGVDIRQVARVAAATGVALITVDEAGENQIAVAPGANRLVTAGRVTEAIATLRPSVVAAVLEVPMDAVVAATSAAVRVGAIPVVNPAPAVPLPDELLAAGPIVVPNAEELAVAAAVPQGTGHASAAQRLLQRGARAVLVTIGAGGAVVYTRAGTDEIPGQRVGEVVDSTGAGDTFCGALAAFLAEGRELFDAARGATLAASLSVRRQGAREGMPRRDELEGHLAKIG